MDQEFVRQLSLEEIKQRELRLLEWFARYCDENNLCYVLAGGTLLGAIRHKGFIPWDDDIDVMMPRPDYRRLLQLLREQQPVRFACVDNRSMNYPFLKILDDTVQIKASCYDETEADFLWIDVFPIDGLPSDRVRNRLLYVPALMIKKLLMLSMTKIGTGTTPFKSIAKIPLALVGKCIGSYRLAKWLDRFGQRHAVEKSDYIGGITWGYGPQERMPKDKWMERVKVEFEGKQFWAPGCWHFYLSSLFGDYMQLPPESKRRTHGISAFTFA